MSESSSTAAWVCSAFPEHTFAGPARSPFCPACRAKGLLNLLKPVASANPVSVNIDNADALKVVKLNIPVDIDCSVADNAHVTGKLVCLLDNVKKTELLAAPWRFRLVFTEPGQHTIEVQALDKSSKQVASVKLTVLVEEVLNEIAMSVILMDASSSMGNAPFDEYDVSGIRLVATTAAFGIFDLERMQNNPNAFVAIFKFSDDVKLVLLDSIDKIIARFNRDVDQFTEFLYEELDAMKQGTNINKALSHAYGFVKDFCNNTSADFPLPRYKIMKQQVVKNDMSTLTIPNIRVLMYTDGKQFDKSGGRKLLPNPFKEQPLPGIEHDILIGAFFGPGEDDGSKELQQILSNCPMHDHPQFFLFDEPGKMNDLRYLFKMASGASGFCPVCLQKQQSQAGK